MATYCGTINSAVRTCSLTRRQDGSIRADLPIGPCAALLIRLLQAFHAMGKLHDPVDNDALIAMSLKTLD